jgi:diacylglycerol kinase (ATP)
MSSGSLSLLVLLLALLAAGGGLLGVMAARRRGRHPIAPAAVETESAAEPAPRPHVAVVVNPTKISDLAEATIWLARGCRQRDLAPAVWRQTTVHDPGHGQTRAVMDCGASAVLAYGGDGTVRAVAAELAGSPIPLGILPAGTGNLLARNLSLPLADPDAALDIALGGHQRRVDVGRVEIDASGEDDHPARDTFCVMAGIGFDAEVMATVAPKLKRWMGWWAYIAAGLRRINGDRTRVTLRLDGGAPIHRWVRSVLVGNCGELTGGVLLMPEALVDDGWLDVVVLAPRGAVGWGAVIATVLTRSRRGYPVVQHLRCRAIEIRAEKPLHVQLDGDPAGTARVLRAQVEPMALRVRTAGS